MPTTTADGAPGQASSFQAVPQALLRKVYRRTVPVAVAVTLVTFIDRSNVALAAPALIADLGLSKAEYGLASGVLMVTYGLLMLPSSLGFTLFGLRTWLPAIVVAWGACTAATGAVQSAGGLYAARLALGAAEAGCMPGCWYLLSAFLPSTELPAAYAWVVAATVVSQVVGGPLAAIFLGPIDGAAGVPGWRWLFIAEGVATMLFGGGLRWALADGPAKAGWLTPDEVAWLGARHAEDEAAARARTGEVAGETAAPTPKILADALLVIRRWQVWLLACMLATVQLAYFAVLFFTPLLISTAFGAAGAGSKPGADTKALAAHTARTALKSTAVYGPAAAAVILAGWVSRRTGDRRWSCVSTLALSCVAFGVLPAVAARSSPGAALATLAVAAAGGVASLAVLTTWPGDYVAAGDWVWWPGGRRQGRRGPFFSLSPSYSRSLLFLSPHRPARSCVVCLLQRVRGRRRLCWAVPDGGAHFLEGLRGDGRLPGRGWRGLVCVWHLGGSAVGKGGGRRLGARRAQRAAGGARTLGASGVDGSVESGGGRGGV